MVKPRLPKFALLLCTYCLVGLSSTRVAAFALLGPFEPWMQTTNGFHQINDIGGVTIGGPMDITNEYRWNVPVITYGFDQSFLEYFGSNGVVAVEAAIQILNNLPPASSIALTNYLLDTREVNYAAHVQQIYDLKSATLSLLLEHLGLASPTRNIGVIRQWTPMFLTNMDETSWPPGTIPTNIIERNFDPETLAPSHKVNDTLYGLSVIFDLLLPWTIDPLNRGFSAVADAELSFGDFYTGLTRDDVGGLRYLFSTNNVNYETLLQSVHGAGTNSSAWVNGAWRPGVDKISFLPQPIDLPLGGFLSMTNRFTDIYIIESNRVSQQVERVIAEPDILFCAEDLSLGPPFTPPFFRRTETTNWIHPTTNAGPGVIQSGMRIVFNKSGRRFISPNGDSEESAGIYDSFFWGTFDSSTNPPSVYPISHPGTNQTSIRMWLTKGDYPYAFQHNFEWLMTGAAETYFTFQTSTNLTDWITLFAVPNDGIYSTYLNQNSASASRFYRVVPEP